MGFMMRNPAFSDERMRNILPPHSSLLSEDGTYANQEFIPDYAQAVTQTGVMKKTVILTGITFLTAVIIMSRLSIDMLLITGILSIIASIVGIIIAFKPTAAKFLAPVYAALEGAMLGFITGLFELYYPGIGQQAVLLTLFATFACLAVYRSNVFSPDFFSYKTAAAGLLAICLFFFIGALDSAFNWGLSIFNYFSPLGILINAAILIFYLYVLMTDFKQVGDYIRRGISKEYEWYLAYGILLTLLMMYVQILKLIAASRSRK